MRYMLLIYGDERSQVARSDEESAQLFEGHVALTGALRDAGRLVLGEPLEWSNSARTVRRRDGELTVTDGPFAETKEQLGGFYLIEADSADEALEWAKRMPGLDQGTVEVRAIMPVPVPQA